MMKKTPQRRESDRGRFGPFRLGSITLMDVGTIVVALATVIYTFAGIEKKVELIGQRVETLQMEQQQIKATVADANRSMDQMERDVSSQLRELRVDVSKLVGRDEGRSERKR